MVVGSRELRVTVCEVTGMAVFGLYTTHWYLSASVSTNPLVHASLADTVAEVVVASEMTPLLLDTGTLFLCHSTTGTGHP